MLAWLADIEDEAPECFDVPIRLIDRAIDEQLIGFGARGQFAQRLLDIRDEGYMRGELFTSDQSTPEQDIRSAHGFRLTVSGRQAARRVAPSAATPAAQVTLGEKPVAGEVRDVFISHGGPDKDSVARPLAEALRSRGFTVWFDEFELVVGDRLSETIDRGLATSRSGVVVLSPAFFARPWPQRELRGLVSTEVATGKPLILPVWHRVDQVAVAT